MKKVDNTTFLDAAKENVEPEVKDLYRLEKQDG